MREQWSLTGRWLAVWLAAAWLLLVQGRLKPTKQQQPRASAYRHAHWHTYINSCKADLRRSLSLRRGGQWEDSMQDKPDYRGKKCLPTDEPCTASHSGRRGGKLLCTHSEPLGRWWCALMARQTWLQHCLLNRMTLFALPLVSRIFGAIRYHWCDTLNAQFPLTLQVTQPAP